MMENDPSKKESKGKRFFKKAIRRTSKSSNNSQGSVLEQGLSVSRSKSFENKQSDTEVNDSTPLPTPDGTTEKDHGSLAVKPKVEDKPPLHKGLPEEGKVKKVVAIEEARNEVYEDDATVSHDAKSKLSPRLVNAPEPESSKKSLKRVRLNDLCFVGKAIDVMPRYPDSRLPSQLALLVTIVYIF